MLPTTSVNRWDLSVTLTEFDLEANRRGFIGGRVMPFIGRGQDQGRWPKMKLEALLQEHETERAPGAGYGTSDADWDEDSYVTKDHGHEVPLDDRTIKRYKDFVDAEHWQSMRAIDIVLNRFERKMASTLFNATTFAGKTSALATAWSDRDNATPLTDIDSKRETIFQAFGQEPNALVINRPTFRNLINNLSLIERLKYQGFQDARPGEISAAQLAISLDLDQVIVAGLGGGGATNSANPAQSKNISRIWPSTMSLLTKVAETDDPGEPCLGRSIVWTEEGVIDGDELGVIVEEYRKEEVRGSKLRARTDYVQKLLFAESSHLFTNVG